MKTEQLVDLLARQAGPAPRHVVETRLALAVTLGLLASVGAAAGVLGLNTALADMGMALLAKLGYVAGLAGGAVWLAGRVARPGARWQAPARATALVLLGMTLLALSRLATTHEGERLALLLGRSWTSCPWRVAALSVPALVATLWAMRGLAPTRPRLAGFTVGLLAGALGALGYALYCTEVSPLFVLVWYTLGMLVPAGAGALLGPRLLRW